MIIPKLFKENWKKFLSIFLVCALFLILIVAFSTNYLLLGGEGDYFTNFNLENSYIGAFSWAASKGTGVPNATLSGTVGIFDFFSLLQKLGMSFKIVNTLSVFLVYTLPFLSMLWMLNRILKIKFNTSFLISLFYILNPFSTGHLQGLMFWNIAPLFILPLAFGILYKYFFNKFKLFLIFGLFTAIFAFSFANIPYLGIFHIFLLISIIIISYLHKAKFEFKTIFKNILITEWSFFLFNCWWIINLFRFYLYDINEFYPKSFAISWAKMSSGGGDIINKIFSAKQLLYSGYNNYFSHFYFNPIIIPILFIPFIILIILLFRNKYSNQTNKNGFVIFAFLLIIFYLNKGVNHPFGGGYLWAVVNIPSFEIFKSPFEKFSVLFVFLFSLSLSFAFSNVKNKIYYGLFIFYLLICSIPYLTLNFIPDYKLSGSIHASRLFVDKSEYRQAEEILNNEKLIYRILSLPGSLNYQVAMLNHDQKYYTGMDPVLYAINKPFIAVYAGKQFNVIYDNISDENFNKIISLFNINKILLNKDIYPWFGFREKESISELSEIFSEKMHSLKNGSIELYTIDPQYYLPHFYVPQKIIYTNTNIEDLPDILSFGNWEIRSAIYFENINELEELKKKTDEIYIKAELKNAVTEEELGISLLEVSFPYVRHKPVGLMYQLVLMNEEFDRWKVRKNPEKIFEKNLFYASKRIVELASFKINGIKQWNNLLKSYEQEMESALRKTEEINKLETYLKAHRRKIDQANLDEEIKDKIRNIFDDLEGKMAELEPKQDFSKLVYQFNISKSGNYSWFIKDINGLDISELKNYGEKDGDWIKIGERNFKEGKQELVLPFNGISENLIDENLKIKDYSPDSIYRISFDYKAPRGGGFFVAEGKDGEAVKTQLPSTGDEFGHFEVFFKSSSNAQEASVHLPISVKEEKNLRIEKIYQPEIMLRLKNTDTRNLILDSRGTMPKITFVKINPTKYRVKVEGAKNPYTLVFSESFHKGWKAYISNQRLVINGQYEGIVASYFDGEIKEGTHKNISFDKNIFETWSKKSISEDKHSLINGYANSWYIAPEDTGGRQDYELIIEYWPQQLFYIGLFISGITLAGCLIYFLYTSIVRRNRQ